ncbi:putative E3 ubiquitin-protein ligase LUL3 [Gracilariopsis chorda]|uniref:RING-type E3 ubiquitin transferase n=1 Tax=Gracilariopsis chorda TaxID=448386 RepID=A0A2V3IQX4_9FLOR|nr:putative E3 ubiquitin-protein ligase LUL3 [Gracilariopsis chorda]|eukprot:PXF44508.1 putative E3 ubiquitin-protein ligase LUL3 [Gracilariopsis chorda]
MGIVPSHENDGPPSMPLPPPRPSLGPRPTNPQSASFPNIRTDSRLMRSVEYLPPVKMGQRVSNVFILRKENIRLLPTPSQPPIYLVEFTFRADVQGTVQIYFNADEKVHQTRVNGQNHVHHISYVSRTPFDSPAPFPAAENQVFRQREQFALDLANATASQLKYSRESTYPLVIKLDATSPSTNTPITSNIVRSHITLAEFSFADSRPSLRVIEQKVLIGGTIFSMQDLYGIRASYNANQNGPAGTAEDSSAECVVCLTEPSTTAVQPCKHLCLCDDCARLLTLEVDAQQKCPVCRTHIGKLLRIVDTSRRPEQAAAGNTVTEGNTYAPPVAPPPSAPASSSWTPTNHIQTEQLSHPRFENLAPSSRHSTPPNASELHQGSTHPMNRYHMS